MSPDSKLPTVDFFTVNHPNFPPLKPWFLTAIEQTESWHKVPSNLLRHLLNWLDINARYRWDSRAEWLWSEISEHECIVEIFYATFHFWQKAENRHLTARNWCDHVSYADTVTVTINHFSTMDHRTVRADVHHGTVRNGKLFSSTSLVFWRQRRRVSTPANRLFWRQSRHVVSTPANPDIDASNRRLCNKR
jgi:hypothetical protein